MALLISNAILHSLDNHGNGTVYSAVELEVDSETCMEFVSKHVRRLITAPAAREATFRPNSEVYDMVKGYQKGYLHFGDFSRQLAQRLIAIMDRSKEIPSGDLLVCAFDYAKIRYIAMVKLPHAQSFTRRIMEGEGGTEVRLVRELALPENTTKVTEACLIPYDPMVLRILEQPYPLEGEMTDYFSHLFLECDTQISKKETAQLVRVIADEVNQTYFGGDMDMEARIKQALVEAAPEDPEEGLVLETAAKYAFGDNAEAVTGFVDRVKEAGLPHAVSLPKPYVQREFKTQRIKADNGIELKFPLELSQNPEVIQIITNPDGTLTVTLKNLRPAD